LRYFFHVTDGTTMLKDEEGQSFCSLDDAKAHASAVILTRSRHSRAWRSYFECLLSDCSRRSGVSPWRSYERLFAGGSLMTITPTLTLTLGRARLTRFIKPVPATDDIRTIFLRAAREICLYTLRPCRRRREVGLVVAHEAAAVLVPLLCSRDCGAGQQLSRSTALLVLGNLIA